MKFNFVNILLIALIFYSQKTFAQTESPSGFGSLGLSLGNATTAIEGHYALWSNPAGILFQEKLSANVDFINLYNNSGIYDLQAGIILPTKKYGHWGLTIQRYGLDEFNFQCYGLTYGRKLSSKFNAALTFNLYQFQISEYGNAFIPNIEFGIQTQISRKMTLGAHLKDPLPIKIGTRNTFPATLSVGIKYKINNLVNIYSDIEKNTYERENIRFGIQYRVHPVMEIMLGVNTYPSTFSGGIRLKFGQVQTTAANSFHQILGNTAGLGVQWEKRKNDK